MSKNQKNKNGWDKRRKMVAVIAGGMAVLLLLPIVAEIFTYALA
jgi:hypothetical protein